MRDRRTEAGETKVWHMKRYLDGDAEGYEEFALTLSFAEPEGRGAAAGSTKVAGHLGPCDEDGDECEGSVALDGELTRVALRLEHHDPLSAELCVYRSERFVTEGDGHFRGIWMRGGRTGRFSAARRKSLEEPRKRKSACRRKADAEIKSKRFFNDLKDELLILDRLGWTEKRWKEESKLEKGRAILRELCRELGGVLAQLGLRFEAHTPWLQRIELGIEAARHKGDADLLRRLRAVDCGAAAPRDDCRSDWHALFEILRHYGALPPFRATKFLEPSNIRHSLRCAEIRDQTFENGIHIGDARRLALAAERLARSALRQAGDEAYVHIQLVIRAGGSEFIWEPGDEVLLYCEDRVYYEQAPVWSEEQRARSHSEDQSEETCRAVFERLLTGGRPDLVYEEDFEFVEMTSRAESGAAEGVPAFLEHSVTGSVEDAQALFERVGRQRGWAHRPKALNLGRLFETRLAGYRHQRTREIVWGPGPDLYWERGDRPLRLLRMAQEPVRVAFHGGERPFGFHLQDLRGGTVGVEVVEVSEGSPADARGVVVGRTVKRLIGGGRSEDVRHWTRAQIEEAMGRVPGHFVVEFGKGDTEERRHAPLGDAEMAILMDERFMRGFLHELWQCRSEGARNGGSHLDREGWARVFPGLEPSTPVLSHPPDWAPAASSSSRPAASGSSSGGSAGSPLLGGVRGTPPFSPSTPPPLPPGPCPATAPTPMPFWMPMPCDSTGSLEPSRLPTAAPLAAWGLAAPRDNSPMRVPLPTGGGVGGLRQSAAPTGSGSKEAFLPLSLSAPGLSLLSGSAAGVGSGRGGLQEAEDKALVQPQGGGRRTARGRNGRSAGRG